MTSPQSTAEKNPFLVLAIVLTAIFMNLLDVSIVNVAIPSIQVDLGATFADNQLVLAGYQLSFACLLITGGRLGDIFGRKRLFMLGMLLFTVASALCGLAPNPTFLILSRVLQGAGAGLMVPQVLAIIQVTIPPRERGRAFGIYGATIGIATILGPLVGGALIALDLFGSDWRMIFLVNIPVGALSLLAAWRELPESRAPDKPRLDIPGALLVTTGLFLIVFPLTEGRQRGWPTYLLVMLAAAAPVLVLFVVLQIRKTATGKSPLLLTSLFKNRSFVAGMLLSMLFFAGIPAFFFTFSLYLQIGLGFSALHAGLTTFTFALASGIASSRSDKLAKRLGTGVLRLGAASLAVGMAVTIVVLHVGGTDITSYEISPFLLICGFGLGCFVAPVTNLVLAGIHGREAGSASGVLATGQQIGGALGVALIGIIFFGLLSSHASASAKAEAAGLRSALVTAQVPESEVTAQVASFERCFVLRSKSPDPTATPKGCAIASGGDVAVGRAFLGASDHARRTNFLHAIERTLVFEVVVYLLAALSVSLLPKVDVGSLGQAAPASE